MQPVGNSWWVWLGHCAALGKRFDIDRIALVATQHHQVALLILPNDKANMPAALPLEYHDAAIRRFRQTGSAVHPGFRPIPFFRNIPAGCLQTVSDKRSAPRRFGVSDHAKDAMRLIRATARHLGVNLPGRQYFDNFPWAGDYEAKRDYYQLNA